LQPEVGTSAPVRNRIFDAELMVRNWLKKRYGMEGAEPSKWLPHLQTDRKLFHSNGNYVSF